MFTDRCSRWPIPFGTGRRFILPSFAPTVSDSTLKPSSGCRCRARGSTHSLLTPRRLPSPAARRCGIRSGGGPQQHRRSPLTALSIPPHPSAQLSCGPPSPVVALASPPRPLRNPRPSLAPWPQPWRPQHPFTFPRRHSPAWFPAVSKYDHIRGLRRWSVHRHPWASDFLA